MSGRPARSSSIPIPRMSSGNQRNIENLISGPFLPSSSVRSASLQSRQSFEPRVIRAPPDDPPCTTQTRRPAALSPRASSSAHKHSAPPQTTPRPPTAPVPVPTYLEYSALRHLLQTDPAVTPIPARRATAPTHGVQQRYQSYSSAMSPSSGDDDDGTASPPPREIRSPPVRAPSPEHVFKLPTRWSDAERHPNLSLSEDGRDLKYQGTSCNGDKEAAAARTIHHIPPACGIFYYEVEIQTKEQKARISIGFSGRNTKLNRLPGWEPNTWGFYGDDGFSVTEKSGVHHGSPYGSGDIIGCGIDFTTHKAFLTKNGVLIGPAFEGVGRGVDIYPAIGLQHLGETIRANFGQDPFKYDIDSHVQQARTATWNRIMSTQLSSSLLRRVCQPTVGSIASITHDTGGVLTEEQSKLVLNQLVQSYLIHHGYARTAKALENRDAGSSSSPSADQDVDMNPPLPSTAPVKSDITEDIENRIRIVKAVQKGEIDGAINDLERFYPKVLAADDKFMLFKLRCRKFIELMLGTSDIRKRVKKLKEKEASRRAGVGAVPLGSSISGSSTSSTTTPQPQYRQHQAHDEFWMDEDMEIDDEGPSLSAFSPPPAPAGTLPSELDDDDNSYSMLSQQYEAALNEAIEYGRKLSDDYQSDPREEVQDIFKKTCGIVAWDDPLDVQNPLANFVGYEARAALAHEVNDAILKSQGKPAQPPLETLYRHTVACVTQLGMLGVGSAAFADIQRELVQ